MRAQTVKSRRKKWVLFNSKAKMLENTFVWYDNCSKSKIYYCSRCLALLKMFRRKMFPLEFRAMCTRCTSAFTEASECKTDYSKELCRNEGAMCALLLTIMITLDRISRKRAHILHFFPLFLQTSQYKKSIFICWFFPLLTHISVQFYHRIMSADVYTLQCRCQDY